MLAKALLSLGVWLRFAAGQDAPEPGPQPPISNTEGDLLFLLDSSASVSHYEFSRVKEFMWDLLQPLPFGPRDVQTSIIHISTTPTMEFPFDRYLSRDTLQKALRDTRQLMGDTNTGQALSYAKEQLFSGQAGARQGVPKVLVWVTDGFSTDDISEPMQLLKDMGVTVFIVSTGRGNFLQLSAAASQPSDRHLHFVDVDDLPIITQELRDGILDVIQANRLHATDVTSSSFRLTWPKLLSQETGYYSLEYAPTAEPARKRTQQVSGGLTSLVLSGLAPQTTYEVALIPESNVHFFPPQSTRVTTLPEEISPVEVLISESGPHSFHVGWAPVLDSVATYQVLYGPLPGNSVQVLQVDGRHNSTLLEHLAPNTTYLVTVTAIYRSGKEKSLSAKACTQEEGSKVRHLRLEPAGPNSVRASWDPAEGSVLGYRVRCRRSSGRSAVLAVPPQVRTVLLPELPAGTGGTVCVQPVYGSRPGETLCRALHRQPGRRLLLVEFIADRREKLPLETVLELLWATEARGYRHRQRA